MIGRHHFVLGTVAAGVASAQMQILPWQQPGVFALALLAGGLAALLPDLDTRHNHLRQTFGLNRSQRRGIWAPIQFMISWPLDRIAASLPHRGVTHWLLTGLLLAGAVRALTAGGSAANWLWPVFLAGYLSHLLADSLTRAGAPLLAPVVTGPVRLLPRALCVRTGSRAETGLVRAMLLGAAVWFAQAQGWLSAAAAAF